MRIIAASIAACLMLAQPASADRAEEAFAAGRFLEAAEIAATEGGADNYAKAARAILADAIVSNAPQPDRLDAAEHMARQALAVDPRHIEGRLQLAIALSMKSREMSTREALDSGYGKLARDLAESVIADDPDNAYAHGFLAVWNVEVVRRGGSFGSAIMGASMSKARDHFDAAVRNRPYDPSLHWQFARALAALNARKYDGDIADCLTRAASADPDTALDAMMQTRARAFRDYAAGHSRRDVERMAESLL